MKQILLTSIFGAALVIFAIKVIKDMSEGAELMKSLNDYVNSDIDDEWGI